MVSLPPPSKKDKLEDLVPKKPPLVPPPIVEKETPPEKSIGKIAIVIDDLGQDLEINRAFMALDKAITVAILPGLQYSQKLAEEAKNKGNDILLHLPMEPEGYSGANPGKGALLSNMGRDQLIKVLKEDISAIPHLKGINNHMGSKLTANPEIMEIIFKELEGHSLFFLDSNTSVHSQAYEVAKKHGLKAAKRDIFLDNDRNTGEITRKISQLQSIAIKKGKAVAIGHPYAETLTALKESLPDLRKNGVRLVPLSEIVEWEVRLTKMQNAKWKVKSEKGMVWNEK